MKACRDCRFFFQDEGTACFNPAFKTFDPVMGWQAQYPAEIRKEGGKCGPNAGGFEPRKSFWQHIANAIRRQP